MGQKLGVEDCEQWLEDCPQRVFDNWQAAYRLRPFGDEQELLARVVSLLILIASKSMDMQTVIEASNSLMKSLMGAEWVGNITDAKPQGDSVTTFEATVAKVFG